MGQENCELNPNPIRLQAKQDKTNSKSNKSNYNFFTKFLTQNAQIVQIKYINLKLDNKSYMYSL